MSSRFANLFKKTDPDEQRAFQRRAHAVLSRLYPEQIFSLTDDPLTLESDGQVFGLSNLRSNFLLTPQTESDLELVAKAQFDPLFSGGLEMGARELPWDEVRNYLMPQLMPEEFLGKADLVHVPVDDGVMLAFVIDAEKSYSYVTEEDRGRWGIELDKVRSVAFDNLRERSQGIEMMAFPGENAFFIINTMDGFDAVRLLEPEMQRVIAEHIGDPFYAGIPNRDFLICWSKSADPEFQSKMRQQVSSDFDERPYPLSRRPFEVEVGGEIELTALPEPDPRAASADLN